VKIDSGRDLHGFVGFPDFQCFKDNRVCPVVSEACLATGQCCRNLVTCLLLGFNSVLKLSNICFYLIFALLLLYAELMRNKKMPRKKIYSEPKRKVNLSLTETATKWLEEKRVQLTASSLSDVIERLARELPKNSIKG
jgi:hypothetical protein